jgi:hypothetical protein
MKGLLILVRMADARIEMGRGSKIPLGQLSGLLTYL